jgi:protein-tyrosine phosphatase
MTAVTPAPTGWKPLPGAVIPDRKGYFTELKQDLSDLGNATLGGLGEALGVLELTGFRYGVSKYESKVDDHLTRGSRIDDPKSYEALKKAGFKGIVDLTKEGTKDAELAPKQGLNTLNVKILDNAAPTDRGPNQPNRFPEMKAFLDFATNPKNQPCYVHCEAGKGRTGVAVACYRMAVNHWTEKQAIEEGKKFGLVLNNQIEFLHQFGAALRGGKIEGYAYPKP